MVQCRPNSKTAVNTNQWGHRKTRRTQRFLWPPLYIQTALSNIKQTGLFIDSLQISPVRKPSGFGPSCPAQRLCERIDPLLFEALQEYGCLVRVMTEIREKPCYHHTAITSSCSQISLLVSGQTSNSLRQRAVQAWRCSRRP